MLTAVSKGIISFSFVLAGLACLWLAADLLIAAPSTLIFEELAIGCAGLAPILCLFGWGLRWTAAQFGH
ncbi:hypothetical protein [Acidisoma sp. 7E03]